MGPYSDLAQIARSLMIADGKPLQAAAIAAEGRLTSQKSMAVLKAAVAGGSLSDPTWAGNAAVYDDVVATFI